MVDDGSGALAALRAACGEVPEAGAEVGAAEERVRSDAEEQDDGNRVSERHLAPTSSASGAGGGGPLGP